MNRMMVTRWLAAGLLLVATGLVVQACGGGGSTPNSPSTGGGGGGGATGTTTITITSTGVSPAQLTVSPGTRVLFVNNDSQNHTMNSDPHPLHGDCSEIDQVGFITPGQTKETGNLNTVRTCGYHDHNLFPQPQWQGQITIR